MNEGRGWLHNILNGLPRSQETLAQACSLLGSLLVSCTLSLILVMPLTEYFWNPDNFAHGGPDFEFGLLTVLTSFCLLQILLQLGKRNLLLATVLKYWRACLFRAGQSVKPPRGHRGLFLTSLTVPLSCPMTGRYDLPLKI